jgi:signal transduction histidine kinase
LFSGLGYLVLLASFVSAARALENVVNLIPIVAFPELAQRFVMELWASACRSLPPLPLLVVALNVAPRAGHARNVWLAGAALLYGLASWLPILFMPSPSWPGLAEMCAIAALIVMIYEFHQRALNHTEALMRARIDRTSLDAELHRARLNLLRMQIEPHFLFNTLVNVRRLSRTDRQAAAQMIAKLRRYLAAALPRLREDESLLGEEMQLVSAYLDIHVVRMSPRLTYEIVLPAELSEARVPSMMLLTLVENALKHGVNPLVEGGFVRISAAVRDSALILTVADSGQGMTTQQGHGIGLANVRARLRIMYGLEASLTLGRGRPRGFVASISLPLRTSA